MSLLYNFESNSSVFDLLEIQDISKQGYIVGFKYWVKKMKTNIFVLTLGILLM